MTSKKSKQPIPGFAFCNSVQCTAQTTYMREHGTKIRELFSQEESNQCIAWQAEVLEELIAENQEGFFVTDLNELQELTTNLYKLFLDDKIYFMKDFQRIISLSMVPFRKISNGDDRRCFHHIGGFFGSLCPIIKLPYPDLQIEAAKAILWFAQNCGPLRTNEESTFYHFFPATDQIALYSFIPTQLHVGEVIEAFVETLISLISNITEKNCSSDLLSLCFRALFEFVKRGQSNFINAEFVNSFLSLILNYSEMKISASENKAETKSPICSTRVYAHALLFIDSFIQESPAAMEICGTQTFCGTMWSIFVEYLFSSFKNVQKRLRNEILGIIIIILNSHDPTKSLLLEKNLINKMFDLSQSIALLQPDLAATISYSSKTRNIRLTHEPVDIEMIFLAQDLALVLHQKTNLPIAKLEFIEHQVHVLNAPLNKYLEEHKPQLVVHALQLLRAFVQDVTHFVEIQGPETLMQMIVSNPIKDETLFYVLLLVLHLYPVFRDPIFINSVLDLPRSNDQIMALIMSLLAAILQRLPNDEDQQRYLEIVDTFIGKRSGLEILKRSFKCNSCEVVLSSIDCARSIAQVVFSKIDQRLVFMLLDCADSAPTLLRYAFVGLFLDLLPYQEFIDAALLWKSLSTNSNMQKTVVKWWREEEDRLDIRYDKCIIIDIDHPLDGHPLAGHTIKKVVVNKSWLLDSNTLTPPKMPYKLDFRARLYLLLSAFPPLNEADCKPTDRIKELMIRSYKELKKGAVWSELKEQLSGEEVKPLHDDKLRIQRKLQKMRDRSLNIQEEQCDIWHRCENDRIAVEQRTYKQLSDGLKTAQYVAENYKQIVNSQPIAVSKPYQGRTVKGEDVLVRSGNLRNQQKQDMTRSADDNTNDALEQEKELEETYINDCLQDESISYLVQLMKNSSSM